MGAIEALKLNAEAEHSANLPGVEIMHGAASDSGEELYRRFREGDSLAFEALVSLYYEGLSKFICGIVRDTHETEHLTIETFAQLALNEKGFEGRSSLKTYLYGIAKNLTFQHMKKRKREQHLSFDEIAGICVDENELVQDKLEKEDSRKRLTDAMRRLKTEYHAVLLLLYFEGLSYAEAGKVMKKSERQIKDLAYRAKQALKKKLEEDEG